MGITQFRHIFDFFHSFLPIFFYITCIVYSKIQLYYFFTIHAITKTTFISDTLTSFFMIHSIANIRFTSIRLRCLRIVHTSIRSTAQTTKDHNTFTRNCCGLCYIMDTAIYARLAANNCFVYGCVANPKSFDAKVSTIVPSFITIIRSVRVCKTPRSWLTNT